ncbi:DUF1365 domain-containing protein [Ahrensia sp. 13_GOM-1096m]|uniref:DUF1365 domain-containing protein n=1 Tax=Ahrensia sp. 13_GOM-1096m TaxID=1380380 RepID=UPI000684ECE6|nr:DUF1365 domain-containing protein [Ahrensia sp. 13_GOM-1096m]
MHMQNMSNQALFPPPGQAATLYPGKVMHARLKPFGHRFNYRVFNCLFDLDRLADASTLSSLFSVGRFNLISFYERDHLPEGEKRSLRDYASALTQEAGVHRPHRILLLAYPRILGFVFNPISVYFCYDASDHLTAVIYEVRNTFGERHSYVCKVENGQLTSSGLRQERTKIFYVSPFIDMGMRYHFRITPPGKKVKFRIFETDGTDPLLSATFIGEAKPFTTLALTGQVARLPFMTLKVVAGIHWEALKLWVKGAKYRARGTPPDPVSYKDRITGPAE